MIDSILSFFLGCILSVYIGLVASWGWVWFVVPLGMPAIGLMQAAGLVALIKLPFTSHALQIALNGGTEAQIPFYLRHAAVAAFVTLAWGWMWVLHHS